jgi:2'-5' RNA ligase
MEIRRQLSLYVPAPVAASLEAARRLFDPVQHRLIPAHVTVCREDEIADLPESVVQSRLGQAQIGPITLQFGPPEQFSGHGILLNCLGGEGDFHRLRVCLLGTAGIRRQPPHITLAHPRNPKAPGNQLDNIATWPEGFSITFSTLYLIEQIRHKPWAVLQTFVL